ncbi:ribosome silencing factor [Staphylococcus sp. 11261D007BR]
MNSKELLALSVEAADQKKAEDIVSITLKGISDVTDYFVVCHGNNERQVQAIAKSIKDSVEAQGIDIKKVEGANEGRWILIDLVDVVVHVFHKDERQYYNIEKLYSDAEMLGYQEVVKS